MTGFSSKPTQPKWSTRERGDRLAGEDEREQRRRAELRRRDDRAERRRRRRGSRRPRPTTGAAPSCSSAGQRAREDRASRRAARAVPTTNETSVARSGLPTQLCELRVDPELDRQHRAGRDREEVVRPRCHARGIRAKMPLSLPRPLFHRNPGGSMLSFGVTVLPDPPYQRLIELTKLAEEHGFEYGWTYDSHVLWQESMPVLALARRPDHRRSSSATCVTNPGDPRPDRRSRARTPRCRTSRTAGWSWASAAATPRVRVRRAQAGEGRRVRGSAAR